MEMLTAIEKRNAEQRIKREKYGRSGGPEGRGILAKIKSTDLPDETLQDFSSAPFTFEETAQLVAEDMEKLHYMAGTANRFSENYMKCLPQLERYINKACSLCLTKAVLEQKGFSFPKLENLNTLDLICMVSFHIRKCHAALDGLYRDNNRLGYVYLQWELRWINLGERLKATEVKIQKVKAGKLKADDLLSREENFREEARAKTDLSGKWAKSALVNPMALPLLTSAAKNMLQYEQIQQREHDRAMRSLGIKTFPMAKVPLTTVPQPEPETEQQALPIPEPKQTKPLIPQKLPDGLITEAEARKILIEDALRRHDQKALLEIQREDSDAFEARWILSEYGAPLKPPGPSNEVRKKLREKRKKKK